MKPDRELFERPRMLIGAFTALELAGDHAVDHILDHEDR